MTGRRKPTPKAAKAPKRSKGRARTGDPSPLASAVASASADGWRLRSAVLPAVVVADAASRAGEDGAADAEAVLRAVHLALNGANGGPATIAALATIARKALGEPDETQTAAVRRAVLHVVAMRSHVLRSVRRDVERVQKVPPSERKRFRALLAEEVLTLHAALELAPVFAPTKPADDVAAAALTLARKRSGPVERESFPVERESGFDWEERIVRDALEACDVSAPKRRDLVAHALRDRRTK